MLSQNSPVAALPPTNVNRNSTPTKIIRIGTGVLPVSTQTNVSPLVTAGRPSSNPRSNSNSKNLRVIQKLAQENLQPASTNPLRSTSRSASRRKQRRWENSNLFGVQELLSAETFNQMIGASENDKDTFADGTGRHYTRYLFPVDDKKSAFADLFLNRELLNIFRRCEEELTSSSSSRATKHVARSVEEQSWMNMEKKIRTIFLSLLPSNNNSDAAQRRDDALSIQPFVFLLCMEKLLFAFVEDELPKGETVLTAASSSSKRDSSTRQLVSYQVDGERGHLRVDLIESSFYRLLFHGICQFYGLKSQSFVVKNSKHKYIQVNKPKKILAAFDQDVSITKYLYWKILSEDMSNIPDSTSLPAIETLSLSSEVAQANTILTATALTANDNSSADPVQRASETSTPTLGNASLSTVSLGGDGSRSPPPNDLVRPLIQPETEEQAEDYIVIDMDDLGDGEEEK